MPGDIDGDPPLRDGGRRILRQHDPGPANNELCSLSAPGDSHARQTDPEQSQGSGLGDSRIYHDVVIGGSVVEPIASNWTLTRFVKSALTVRV